MWFASSGLGMGPGMGVGDSGERSFDWSCGGVVDASDFIQTKFNRPGVASFVAFRTWCQ